MTNEQVKKATKAVLEALVGHVKEADDSLVVLGTAISAVARVTEDPVQAARIMILGLENWIVMYESEQRAVRT